MRRLKSGVIGGAGSRRNWHPKSNGSNPELQMFQLLTDAGHKFRSGIGEGANLQIKTRFRNTAFRPDFLLPSEIPDKYLGLVVEVQGGLHRHTWKGKPALGRMKKDAAKRECLIGEKYVVTEIDDDALKKYPEACLDLVRQGLAGAYKYAHAYLTRAKEYQIEKEALK